MIVEMKGGEVDHVVIVAIDGIVTVIVIGTEIGSEIGTGTEIGAVTEIESVVIGKGRGIAIGTEIETETETETGKGIGMTDADEIEVYLLVENDDAVARLVVVEEVGVARMTGDSNNHDTRVTRSSSRHLFVFYIYLKASSLNYIMTAIFHVLQDTFRE